MTYKLKVLQQGLEQEEGAHKATKARLADKNKISESIEGAKSEAVKGIRVHRLNIPLIQLNKRFFSSLCVYLDNVTLQDVCLTQNRLKLNKLIYLRVFAELEQKLQEERSSKQRVENRLLELEKKNSMLDCDYKQSLQKLEELRRNKDRLTEEVCVCSTACFSNTLYCLFLN